VANARASAGYNGWLAVATEVLRRAGQRRWLRRVVVAGLLAASLGTLAYLLLANLEALRAAPWRLEPVRLVAGLALMASTVAIATLVWADLSGQLGAGWNLRRDARAYAYALAARRLPGSFWHVVGRAVLYGQEGLGRRVGVLGSALEAGLLIVTGAALFLALSPLPRPVGPAAAVLVVLGAPPLFARLLPIVAPGSRAWLPPIGRLYRWVALDLASWLLGMTGVFLLFDALYPLDPSMWRSVVLATTGSILAASAVLVLPGGLGLRELTLVGLLGDQISPAVAAALALAFRVTMSIIEAVWALVVLVLVRPRQ
jgi:uncharacterized membrane protein YbhN (UPF0104 family)